MGTMLRGCVGLVESRFLSRTTHKLRHLLYVMGLSWLDEMMIPHVMVACRALAHELVACRALGGNLFWTSEWKLHLC